MFIVQLVRTWVQQGLLQASSGGFVLREDMQPEIPDSLYGVWLSRLRLLREDFGEDVILTLEAAAALGDDVDALEWNHLCSLLELDARPSLLGALLKGGMARETERGWEFAHERLRDSLERSALSAGRRPELHRACLAMLQQRYSEGVPGLDLRLRRHREVLAGSTQELP
jgi:hypothetical protein